MTLPRTCADDDVPERSMNVERRRARRPSPSKAYTRISIRFHRVAFARVGANDGGEAVVGCSRARSVTDVSYIFDFVEDE